MLLLFLQLLLLVCSSSRAKCKCSCNTWYIYLTISTVMLNPDGDVLLLCEGDFFTITCVTDTGFLLWSLGHSTKSFSNILPVSNTLTKLNNSVTVVLVSSSVDQFTSVATVLEAQSTLNGTVLSCKDNGDDDGAPKVGMKFLIAGMMSRYL